VQQSNYIILTYKGTLCPATHFLKIPRLTDPRRCLNLTDNMEAENRKLVSPVGALIDVAISFAVFLVFMFVIIPPHVFVYDPVWKMILSAYCSVVMGGFTWLALCLFRVTLMDQLRAKKAKSQ